MIRSRKVLNSAKGQPCAARFPGICNSDPATTVWAHLNGAAFGKGMGVKAHDVLGFHACADCHAYYDVGHGTRSRISNDTLIACVLEAVCETWVRLIRANIVIVPLDPETLSTERKVTPRKPPQRRAKIVSRAKPWPAKGTRKIPKRQRAEA